MAATIPGIAFAAAAALAAVAAWAAAGVEPEAASIAATRVIVLAIPARQRRNVFIAAGLPFVTGSADRDALRWRAREPGQGRVGAVDRHAEGGGAAGAHRAVVALVHGRDPRAGLGDGGVPVA